LIITALNYKGATNNLDYILKTTDHANIVPLFETWAEEWSESILCLLKKRKKYIDQIKKRGRMSGGLAWIITKIKWLDRWASQMK
jgi:hypothetical protein